MRRQTEHNVKIKIKDAKGPKTVPREKGNNKRRKSWSTRKRVVSRVFAKTQKTQKLKDGTKIAIHKIYFLNAHYSHSRPHSPSPTTTTTMTTTFQSAVCIATRIQIFSSFVYGFAHHNCAYRAVCASSSKSAPRGKRESEEKKEK